MQIAYTLQSLPEAVLQLWQLGRAYPVWAIEGDMGAGKTTLIRELCRYLQVKDTVNSPTFALVNEYRFFNNNEDRCIYHMDWYRLKDEEEVFNSGIYDHLYSGQYCFVEWPSVAYRALPRPHLHITIAVTGPEERVLSTQIIEK